jgi:hypothetical protein
MSLPEHSLANEIIGGLGVPKKALALYNRNKQGEYAVSSTKRSLIQATKFSVGDNLLRHAVKASFLKPKYLFDSLHLGIPPFDSMFIEWDAQKSQSIIREEYEQLLPDERLGFVDNKTNKSVGYLIEKTPNGNFLYSQFLSAEDKIWTPPNSFYISHDPAIPYNQNFVGSPVRGGEMGRVSEVWQYASSSVEILPPDLEEREAFERNIFLSKTYHQLFENNQQHDHYLKLIYQRFGVGLHPLGLASFPQMFGVGGDGKLQLEYFEKACDINMEMMSGDIRLLITLLALLNYPQHIYEVEQRDVKTLPRKWGRNLPRNEVKLIEIDLPKPEGIKRYEKMFKGHGTPKRQHVRRGHWRVMHLKTGQVIKKWIEEQTVGNPDLGIIEHEYHLTKKQYKKEA